MKQKLESEPHLGTDPKLVLNKAILVLAELRTFYSLMRTGIALFTFPLTFLAFLVATADMSNIFQKPFMSSLVVGLLAGILAVGVLQMQSARRKIAKANRLLGTIKREFPDIGHWLI